MVVSSLLVFKLFISNVYFVYERRDDEHMQYLSELLRQKGKYNHHNIIKTLCTIKQKKVDR